MLMSLVLAPLLAASLGAWADDDADRARAGASAGRLMPLAQIVEIVQARYPGEVVDVELDDDKYELRVLRPDSRIVKVEVDARTGRILGAEEKGEDH